MATKMTKEQAFRNLSLPENADIETIRIRFAARYSNSDKAHDRSLTPGMRAIHEAHLRSLEDAYKVLTDNPVIHDMGALLSLSKGYITEGGDTLGDDSIAPEEALAFFALYPQDTPVKAEERYTFYRSELEVALEQASLEASKEPFRQEIERAETCLHIAVNYLMANELSLSELVPEDRKETQQDEGEDHILETPPREAVFQKPGSKPKWLLPGAALLLLGIGAAVGLWWAGRADPESPSKVTSVARISDEPDQKKEKPRSSAPKTQNRSPAEPAGPEPNKGKISEAGSESLEPTQASHSVPALNDLAKLMETSSAYRLSEQSTQNTWYLAAKDSTKRNFIVPVSSIHLLNTAGTLQAKPGRSFKAWYAGGKPRATTLVPDFMKRNLTPAQRDQLLAELETQGVQKQPRKTKSGNLTTHVQDTIEDRQSKADAIKKAAIARTPVPNSSDTTEQTKPSTQK